MRRVNHFLSVKEFSHLSANLKGIGGNSLKKKTPHANLCKCKGNKPFALPLWTMSSVTVLQSFRDPFLKRKISNDPG